MRVCGTTAPSERTLLRKTASAEPRVCRNTASAEHSVRGDTLCGMLIQQRRRFSVPPKSLNSAPRLSRQSPTTTTTTTDQRLFAYRVARTRGIKGCQESKRGDPSPTEWPGPAGSKGVESGDRMSGDRKSDDLSPLLIVQLFSVQP